MDNIIFRLSGLATPMWLTGMGIEVLETYIDGSMTIESTNRLVELNTAYELYSRTINIPERFQIILENCKLYIDYLTRIRAMYQRF